MSTRVKVDFSPLAVLNNHGYPNNARLFLANEIVRVSDPYVPFKDGYLKNSVEILNDGRQIQYGGRGPANAYARRMWYGDTFNFKGSPIRGSRWVNRAVASNRNQIIASMQRMADKGGFK